jgi:hypothetical protein
MVQTENETEQTSTAPDSDDTAPPTAGAFSEERARIDRITDRLDVTQDPSERADLGSELVRSISRYEDTFERAVLPHLGRRGQDVLEPLEQDREELRVAMDEIHQRTMGIDPRNVHASDGEGFEATLETVVRKVRALIVLEDREIETLLRSSGDGDRKNLLDEIEQVFKSASERPHPPRTTLGRLVSNVHVKLDHTFEDVATPHHPGANTVNG